LVVTVIITVLSPSAIVGVYVNENGDVADDEGTTVPNPLSVMVTLVADPPKLLPMTVTGVIPHVIPLVLPSVNEGGFTQPHVTEKGGPEVVHPEVFLTDI
jgi:hypothetical protein